MVRGATDCDRASHVHQPGGRSGRVTRIALHRRGCPRVLAQAMLDAADGTFTLAS
jgi:hypothetical protein